MSRGSGRRAVRARGAALGGAVAVLVAVLAVAPAASRAAGPPHQTSPVPGRAWAISFDAPLLDEYQGRSEEAIFWFIGQSSESGLSITVNGSPWPEGDNNACRASWWEKASENKEIDKESVHLSATKTFARVDYVTYAASGEEKVATGHAGFYFVNEGSCVEFHASKFPYAESDAALFTAIAESLSWSDLK